MGTRLRRISDTELSNQLPITMALRNDQTASTAGNEILIVDDIINNLKLLSDMLSQSGFVVRKATSGTMALSAIHASQPDIILLDINMPDMDGYEVCQRLKKDLQTQEIPVIFLSASDITADKVKAFQVGGSDYITKPFHSEEVVARVQNQLLLVQLKSDLRSRNQALEETLSQLKATQTELIQKEKMMGLSQLMAGVAHEINNPISFIVGNLTHAERYFSDLVRVLDLYRQRYPNPEADIQAEAERVDLDFEIQDFLNLLTSMRTGTERIQETVQALQTFSHKGESAIKATNLHDSINSILVLLKLKLRGRDNRPDIQVRRDYDDLPLVTCDARHIGQAILHLLENAIEAIDRRWMGLQEFAGESNDDGRLEPEITIQTATLDQGWISISICDNGVGISDEIKPRIYDPFFTTKSVGQGNGLGLSISYQIIVEKHGGHLSFTSSPCRGSEFTLKLPVNRDVMGG